MNLINTYKYKLKPSAVQAQRMDQWLGVCRLVYNMGLAIRRESWEKNKQDVSRYDLQIQVKDLKQEFDWVKDVHSQVLQHSLYRLDISYKNFFSGKGYPKFQRKGRYNSFTFPQGVKFNNGKFQLPKLKTMKIFKDRLPQGEIKQATVIKEADVWYMSVTFEQNFEPLLPSENQVGVDVGTKFFYTDSNGVQISNPKWVKQFESRITFLQHKMSNQKKGGSNWRKTVKLLNKTYRKMTRKRLDYIHKTSTSLIQNNQLIVAEKLNLKGMTKSSKGTLEKPGKMVAAKSGLNKSMLDVGIGIFFNQLSYKAERFGRTFIQVDPRYTSQTCNACGCVSKENRRSQAEFECIECGHKDNADANAAKNILRIGVGNPVGLCAA